MVLLDPVNDLPALCTMIDSTAAKSLDATAISKRTSLACGPLLSATQSSRGNLRAHILAFRLIDIADWQYALRAVTKISLAANIAVLLRIATEA